MLFSLACFAQVGVGTTTPNGALDVSSSTNGFVPPRVALTATNVAAPISNPNGGGNPVAGTIVWNTNTSSPTPATAVAPGLYYWDGSRWVAFAGSPGGLDWSLTGNSGTTVGTNFIGTTDAQDLRFKTNGIDRMNISNTNGQIQSYYAGATGSPAFSWNGDPNTGMYQGGADVLGFSTNGIERVKMNTTETVVNDASNNYDFRIESDNRTNALFSDASQDAVIFGSTGTLTDDGSSFTTSNTAYTTTIDYVADFDKGTSRGTTMGLGSIEYLVDGEAELFISNNFSPIADWTYDLGWENEWDDIYAQNVWTTSDITAKKDIKPMKYGLDEILKLNTISYKLTRDPFQDPQIGLIAQEVNQFIPEASKTHDQKKNEKGEFETVPLKNIHVSYVSLVPVLVKAIQEQQEQINELKTKIKELENK